MLRGEIRVVDLEPARGSEANKRRPAIAVSNDGANTTAFRLDCPPRGGASQPDYCESRTWAACHRSTKRSRT